MKIFNSYPTCVRKWIKVKYFLMEKFKVFAVIRLSACCDLMLNCDSDRKMCIEIAKIMNWYFIPVNLNGDSSHIVFFIRQNFALVFPSWLCLRFSLLTCCLSQLYQTTRYSDWLNLLHDGRSQCSFQRDDNDSFHRDTVSNLIFVGIFCWGETTANYIIRDNENSFMLEKTRMK